MDLHLRHLEATDIPALFDIYSFPSVSENTSQLPYLSSDKVSSLFLNSDDYTLVAVNDTKVVGHVSLFLSPKIRDRHVAGIGIAVHPESHGKGIGRTLLLEAINQADNWLNLIRLELEVHCDNHGAVALYTSLGFEIEAEKQLSTFKAGQYSNMYLMSRIRPDFAAKA
ncbi:GNAT family N-acetyltransferase [Alginatibacterium sediminis]|uniref:GNAT family N-acetyltransferase n=1 Tax=Alginatibacterium sediminis TaxID=2164068 RepID=A0A420EI71_9ALTE|nr:GNAT family N-acetyltransferase [Alginatibacterium sediminis]RKF20347.1 GNAT family N-acetyltransferase [Alginatibacterium sediminis]